MAWYDFLIGCYPPFFDCSFEHGSFYTNTIEGTRGADSLWGTDPVMRPRPDGSLVPVGGHDDIRGYGGNDRLKGYGGADRLDGGAGIDTVYYGDSTVGVGVNLATGNGYGGSAEGDVLISIEYVFGSLHNDTIIGNDANNEIYGLTGNDVLKGGGGADGLAGDDGDDILKGGGGADYLEGGYGYDTASYEGSPTGVGVSLINNNALWGDAQGDTFTSIENLTGSAYADQLWGDDGRNVLRGLDGNDNLKGYGGDDTLDGGTGIDTMIGGLGSDTYFVDNAGDSVTEFGGEGIDQVRTDVSWTLTAGADVETLRTTDDAGLAAINLTGNANGNAVRGNAGNNVINGGDGRDELTGLGGQDSYLFDTALSAGFNVDVITDFNVADDTIWLDDDIFSSGLTANNSVAGSQFVIGPAALDAGDRIIYNSATGAVLYDSDGTGPTAAVQFAQLSAGLPLTNFDFFVVP